MNKQVVHAGALCIICLVLTILAVVIPSSRREDQTTPASSPATKRVAAPPSRVARFAPTNSTTRQAQDLLPKGYESAQDLHQFFMATKDSADPAVVYQAYRAYLECNALLSIANELRAAFAGGQNPGLTGALTVERQAASADILKRCQGFERMNERDVTALGMATFEKAIQSGSVEAQLDVLEAKHNGNEPPLAISQDVLNRLLKAGTPSALERAAPALIEAMLTQNGVHSESETRLMEIAVNQAQCDLGQHCSTTSFHALLQCVYGGQCQGLPEEEESKRFSETERAQINYWKNEVINRVKAGAIK